MTIRAAASLALSMLAIGLAIFPLALLFAATAGAAPIAFALQFLPLLFGSAAVYALAEYLA